MHSLTTIVLAVDADVAAFDALQQEAGTQLMMRMHDAGLHSNA